MNWIISRIGEAIELGAPLYNQGDHQGCADIYMKAITDLQAMNLRPWHAQLAQQGLEIGPGRSQCACLGLSALFRWAYC